MIKVMKIGMDENFEVQGLFWLESKEDFKVGGTLFYENNEIELELIGSFNDDFFSDLDINLERIYGISKYGEKFTLKELTIKNTDSSAPGYLSERYSVREFYVGDWIELEEEKFYSCIFDLTYLTEWIGKHAFKYRSIPTTNNKLKEQISFDSNEISHFELELDKINATIKETHIFTNNPHKNKVTWNYNSYIKLTPHNCSKPLSWYQENIRSFQELIVLFVNKPVNFKSIYFSGREQIIPGLNQPIPSKIKYFFSQRSITVDKKYSNNLNLINFRDIEQEIDKIFSNWWEEKESLEVFFDLYFDYFYKPIYLDGALLNSIQSLEIYHRLKFEGNVIDKLEYKTLYEKLLIDIKSDYPIEFQNVVQNKLNHGNEISLANRIKEILGTMASDNLEKVIGDPEQQKRFVRKLVDTRNYLSHYDSKGKKNLIIDNYEKFYTLQRIRAINALILFKAIGINEDLATDQILKNKNFYGFSNHIY